MRILLFAIVFLLSLTTQAQTNVVSGKILDVGTGLPIVQAHVFIPKTTFQAFSDSTGNFILAGLPPGRWTIVSAKEGHRIQRKEIIAKRSLRGEYNLVDFSLEKTTPFTGSEISRGKVKKYTDLFFRSLVKGQNWQEISLENPEVLAFKLDPKSKSVTFQAKDVMILKNPTTGYLISVWMDEILDLNSEINFESFFYSYFPALVTDAETKDKINGNRMDIYRDSPELLLRNLMTNPSDSVKISFGNYEGEFNLSISNSFSLESETGHSIQFSFEGDYLALKENGAPSEFNSLKIENNLPRFSPLMLLPTNFNAERLLAMERIEKNARVLEEKIFLHTDRDVYRIGDNIYFKAYVNFGNPLFEDLSSKVLHVELLDTVGAKLDHQLFRITSGTAIGQLTLPPHLRDQNLFLKAYTLWSSNYGPENEFIKPIQVLMPGLAHQSNTLEEQSNGVTLFTENAYPTPGDSVKLSFMVKDIDGKLVPAHLSVSVLDDREAVQLDESLGNISEYLSKSRNLPYPELENFVLPKEYGFNLVGKTMNNDSIPVKSNLEILTNGLFEKIETATDQSGNFELKNLNFEGDFSVVIKAFPNTVSPATLIDLQIKSSPHTITENNFEFPQPEFTGITTPRLDSLAALPPLLEGEILLDEVDVVTKKYDPIGPMPYGKAQQVVEAKDLNLTGLTDQFIRALASKAGLMASGSPPVLIIRTGYPLIMVNGVPIFTPSGSTFSGPTVPEANMSYTEANPQFSRLSDINVFNIERIEISKSTTTIYGADGKYGMINIIMKTGEDFQRDQNASANSFKEFKFQGFINPIPFRNLGEEVASPVMHWNPSLTINQGETSASTHFVILPKTEAFWVIVNGITDQGDPVYGKFYLNTSLLGVNGKTSPID